MKAWQTKKSKNWREFELIHLDIFMNVTAIIIRDTKEMLWQRTTYVQILFDDDRETVTGTEPQILRHDVLLAVKEEC